MFHRLRLKAPRITISPKECLADESIKITVEQLQAYQNVTIHATLERSDVGIFESFARYTADSNGSVDLTRQPSLGGTFTGIEPMGLFSSMKPSPENGRNQNRVVIKDVLTPAEEVLRVYNSHLNNQELYDIRRVALAEATTKRWYKKPEVHRIPVRWQSIRGVLFVPEGNGPFPAVIDIFGTIGGLNEYRASLLASRGFICLALAFYAYDDLPETFEEMDLGYFEEAKDFLELQTEAEGIGIVGTSYGGVLALACATYVPGFKCAVSINGPVFAVYKPFKYKNRFWPAEPVNANLMYKSEGAIVTKYSYDCHDTDILGNSLIEIARSDKSFLFLYGEDDMSYDTLKGASFTESLVKDGKGDYRILVYPGAGHLLEPPNFPHTDVTYTKVFGDHQKWGGKTILHAKAQEKSWQEILAFLKKNLTTKGSVIAM